LRNRHVLFSLKLDQTSKKIKSNFQLRNALLNRTDDFAIILEGALVSRVHFFNTIKKFWLFRLNDFRNSRFWLQKTSNHVKLWSPARISRKMQASTQWFSNWSETTELNDQFLKFVEYCLNERKIIFDRLR
jgi:hypothetical protein